MSRLSHWLAVSSLITFLQPADLLAEPQRFETARPDGSTIHWSLDRTQGEEPAALVVLAQGSGCLSVDRNANLALTRAAFPSFAAMTVEKYGVMLGDAPADDHLDCSDPFLSHHTMTQRVEDYLAVLEGLKSERWWNGRVVLIGGSEGGDVMARLAEPAKADAAILISSGGGLTFGEMVRLSIMQEMERHSVPQEQWPPVDVMFARARENPDSTEIWIGSSLKFWADAIDHRTMDDMLTARTEFLLIQGGGDESAPAEHARIITDCFAADGRCNLTYWEFPGLDHGLVDAEGNSRMEETLGLAAAWAESVIVSDRSPLCAASR